MPVSVNIPEAQQKAHIQLNLRVYIYGELGLQSLKPIVPCPPAPLPSPLYLATSPTPPTLPFVSSHRRPSPSYLATGAPPLPVPLAAPLLSHLVAPLLFQAARVGHGAGRPGPSRRAVYGAAMARGGSLPPRPRDGMPLLHVGEILPARI